MNTQTTTVMDAETSEKNLRRVVWSGLLGSIIEWYDFFLYGVVAGLVFNKLYFSTADPFVALILSYSTFLIGFVARPLGGVVFGHFGDVLGRKKMLVLTLLIMGVATMLIGFIPTYDQIGIAAPILLVLCRIAQGIGLGGEWGGAVLMTYESAPKHRRAFYGSLPQVGMSVGLLLATGVIGLLNKVLPEADFLAWGWRLAFISSALMVFVGSYIRAKVKESPDFVEAQQEAAKKPAKQNLSFAERFPILTMFKEAPQMVFACMGARFMDGVFFNVFAVYSLTYMTNNLKIDRSTAAFGVSIAAIIMTFAIPFWGLVADRVGKARVFGSCITLSGLSVFPAFWLLHTYGANNIYIAWFAVAVPFGFFHAGNFGIMSSLFAESFNTRFRYSGISFVYQFASIFASGATPLIALYLVRENEGQPWYLCAYVVLVSIISVLSTIWIASLAKKEGQDAYGKKKELSFAR